MIGLIKKGLFYTFSVGTESLIAVTLLPILTSRLSPHDYGLWVILFSFSVFLRPALNLMFQDIIRMKFYNSSQQEILGVIKLSILVPRFLGTLISLLHFLIPIQLEQLLHFPSNHIWKVAIFAGLHGFYYLILALLQFEEKQANFLYQQIAQVVICIGTTLILLKLNIGWLSPLYARTFALTLNCGYGLYWIVKKYGNPFTTAIDENYLAHSILTGIKFLPVGLSAVIIPLTDRLVISHLQGVEETSYFGIGGLFSSAIIVVASGFIYAWQPILYKAMNSQSENTSIRYYSILYFLGLPITGILLSIVGIVVAPYLMRYDINLVRPYIIWLNVATVSECFYQHNYIILKGQQRTNMLSFLASVLIFLNLGLVYYFVQNLGGLGAAWGTAFSYLIMTIISGVLIILNKNKFSISKLV